MSAEIAVLGACLIDPKAYWRVADLLRAEHFAIEAHADVWAVICELAAKGDAFDAVTVSERCGRVALEIANSAFTTANVRAYAERVVDRYTERAVVQAGARIARLDGSATERLTEACRIVRELSPQRSALAPAKAILREVTAQMHEQYENKRALIGLSTGWRHVDAMTSGLHPGTLTIVAGRPSMGKSVFGMQLAMHAALAGTAVHVVTLEMTAASCMKRLISADGMVPFDRVQNGSLMEDEDWGKYTAACARLTACDLTLDDSTFDLDGIIARIHQQAIARQLGLVVIDYLGYMKLPAADRQDLRIQEATRALKRLAKDLSIPVVLIAQLNRGVEGRVSHRPTMADLRDSGAIEQDADLILLLHREDYYSDDHHTKGFAELIVAKQRNGRTGTLPFKHCFHVMRFEEAEALPSKPDAPDERPSRLRKMYGRPDTP